MEASYIGAAVRVQPRLEGGGKAALLFRPGLPKDVYGECEATGHRCDFFLLVWHGPNPVSGEMRRGDAQSNPENYDYFIVPVSDWPGAKKVQAKQLFKSYEPIGFADLPARLNLVADGFLESMQAARV